MSVTDFESQNIISHMRYLCYFERKTNSTKDQIDDLYVVCLTGCPRKTLQI